MAQIVLKQTLAALKGAVVSETCPFNGKFTEGIIDFPLGCNALVYVAVGHGSERLTPMTSYISLDNTAFRFTAHKPIKVYDREKLWADMENRDSANSHTISVILTIEPI